MGNWSLDFFFFVLDFILLAIFLPAIIKWREDRSWHKTRELILNQCLSLLGGLALENKTLLFSVKEKIKNRAGYPLNKYARECSERIDGSYDEFFQNILVTNPSLTPSLATPLAGFVEEMSAVRAGLTRAIKTIEIFQSHQKIAFALANTVADKRLREASTKIDALLQQIAKHGGGKKHLVSMYNMSYVLEPYYEVCQLWDEILVDKEEAKKFLSLDSPKQAAIESMRREGRKPISEYQ